MIKISAVIITFQAERTLEPVLQGLQFCDEIVVVDSGSQDRTLEIAKRYNARIFNHPFAGFGPQKKFAVAQAKNEWVLVIDADEVPTPELQKEIQNLFESGAPQASGFEIKIKLVFLGRVMRFSGIGNKYHMRLFSTRKGVYNEAKIHEDVMLEGHTIKLKESILHYSYPVLDDYFTKFNNYTTAAARDMLEKSKSASFLTRWLSFPVHFTRRYVIQLGFLDGYPGLLWALFSAMYPSVKFAKYLEMKREQERGQEARS